MSLRKFFVVQSNLNVTFLENGMRTSWGRFGQHNINTARDAFIAKIIKPADSTCWLWAGAVANCKRYGSVGLAGKSYLAHRLSYLLFTGVDPGELNVCHTCDNGMCVNPAHLFLGTQRDNVLDMESKGRSRHPSGEKHGRAKLSLAEVQSIRRLFENGETAASLSRKFAVSKPTIACIVKNKGWRHHT